MCVGGGIGACLLVSEYVRGVQCTQLIILFVQSAVEDALEEVCNLLPKEIVTEVSVLQNC